MSGGRTDDQEGFLKRIVMALAAAAIGTLCLGAPAIAAPPAYCQHYAQQAVWQFHRNQSIPGCFHGANAVWSPDWAHHYDWCLGAPIEQARAGDTQRGDRLHQCSFEAYGHP
jgi:hypothetical protein